MKRLNVICGLPRSGSTLLCNVINQNPNCHATSTSCLPFFVNNMIQATNSLEFKNLLNINQEQTVLRFNASVRNFCSTFHSIHEKDYIFDKNRAWTGMSFAYRDLFPNGKMIVCVRDIREVFASVIKQDRKNGLIGGTGLVEQKFKECFDANGLIGHPYNAIMDHVNSPKKNVVYLKYEVFTKAPEQTMKDLYKLCEIPEFEHDFNNVENTAYDCDGFYLGKFPHVGSGVITSSEPSYREHLPAWVIEEINKATIRYNEFFGYQ